MLIDSVFAIALLYALARGWRAKSWPSVIGVILRAVLVVLTGLLIGVGFVTVDTGLNGAFEFVVFVSGPLVTFAVTGLYWARVKDVQYLQQEQAYRLLMPWVAVACADVVYLGIGLLSVLVLLSGPRF